MQARKGRTWAFEIEEEITDLATEFTDQLMKDGLTKKILTLLEKLVVIDEIDRLSKEKALGDAKHRHDVSELCKIREKNLEIVLGLLQIFRGGSSQP